MLFSLFVLQAADVLPRLSKVQACRLDQMARPSGPAIWPEHHPVTPRKSFPYSSKECVNSVGKSWTIQRLLPSVITTSFIKKGVIVNDLNSLIFLALAVACIGAIFYHQKRRTNTALLMFLWGALNLFLFFGLIASYAGPSWVCLLILAALIFSLVSRRRAYKKLNKKTPAVTITGDLDPDSNYHNEAPELSKHYPAMTSRSGQKS